jgi:hypothetical protein
MSITKVTDFSKDSFAFEDAVENKFGTKKIKLTALDQGPLLLKLEDCLSYGVNRNNKFIKTNCSITLALGGKDEFVLKLVEKESDGDPPKGDEPVDHKKYQDKRFRLEAVIKIERIYVSDKVTSIQVKLYEAKSMEENLRNRRRDF